MSHFVMLNINAIPTSGQKSINIILDINPLNAMVAMWHHIIVSFINVLAQKGFIGIWISLVEMHQ